MKKNYENNQLIITLSFIFMIITILSMIKLCKIRYRTYQNLGSIVLTDHYLQSTISNEQYQLLKSSNHLYIDNKRYKLEIVDVEKNILKNAKKSYHQIIMRVNFPKKYKDRDYINLTIYNKKEKVIHIFKTCWKEEK